MKLLKAVGSLVQIGSLLGRLPSKWIHGPGSSGSSGQVKLDPLDMGIWVDPFLAEGGVFPFLKNAEPIGIPHKRRRGASLTHCLEDMSELRP